MDKAPGIEALFLHFFINTHILNFYQGMRIAYGCGLQSLYIRHSIYSMVESKELIFLLKAIKNSIFEKQIFQGAALFEIVLLYTKNQRTMARDFRKYCFFKNLGLQ
jgi:hypothetical protein